MGLIRLLLALSVVLGHAAHGGMWDRIGVDGMQAVQVFFMISGFYMTLVLNEKYVAGPVAGPRIYWVFLRSRLLRLFPTYLLIAAATLVTFSLWPAPATTPAPATSASFYDAPNPVDAWRQHGPQMDWSTRIYLASVNVLTIGQESTILARWDTQDNSLHWQTQHVLTPVPAWQFLLVPQAWSIGVELLFYLSAPFLVRLRLPWVFLIIAASIAFRLALAHAGLALDPWKYRLFPSELAFFMIGTLGYHAYCWIRTRGGIHPWLSTTVLLAVATLILAHRIPFGGHEKTPWTALLYAAVALAIPIIFWCTRHLAFDRFIGELSYPVYISHWLIIKILERCSITNVPIILIATLLISAALYFLLDRPIDRWRQRLAAHAIKIPKPIASSAVSTSP